MALKVTIATSEHYQYFNEEIIINKGGYIISDASSVQGLFSFINHGSYATVTFNYVFNMEAIKLAMESYLNDYPEVSYIEYQGKQNLKRANFVNNQYERK